MSMVIFTFSMRRHLIRLTSAPYDVFPPVYQLLVVFGFLVPRMGSTTQNLRRVGENSDPILNRLWTKVHEVVGRCRKPLVLSNALFRLSVSRFFRRYSPLSLEVVENGANSKVFRPPIFVGGTAPTFLRQLVRATYYTLWLGSVCCSSSARCGNEAEFAEGG